MLFNIPNTLSIFRIVSAPFLLYLSYFGYEIDFKILFCLMLLSDALDGMIARALDQTSAFGARLDSYGDILTYLSVALSMWFLWPELIKKELSYLVSAIFLFILPAFFSFAKFGKLASYHTWITKISALLMSGAIVILIFFQDPSLFHIAVWFLVVECIENITITLILSKQRTDIHSLWHAWQNR